MQRHQGNLSAAMMGNIPGSSLNGDGTPYSGVGGDPGAYGPDFQGSSYVG